MAQQTENGKVSIPSQEPFSITFTWMDKYATVKLKNGEDVLKLADIFSNMLIENGIENILEYGQ